MQKKIATKPQEIIFGIHPIIELLKAKKRQLYAIYTTKPTPKSWHLIEPLLPKRINLQYVSREVLHKLAGTTDHQGVVGYTTPLVIRKKFFNPLEHPFLVMLDGVQDTRNIGAIIRSAYCTNASGIIITKKNTGPLNASTAKASAGLMEHIDIYETASASTGIQELKGAGYAIYLAALGGTSLTQLQFKQPLCIVIGNENSGISPEILKAGERVMLPQKTSDISYNASVAAGILLFYIATQNNRF